MAGLTRPERPPLVAVTDHALERYRQRVPRRTGALDLRPELTGRVARAWAAGQVSTEPPPGAVGQRGSVYVADTERAGLVFVCLHDRPRGELVVVTVWEAGDVAAVPRRFTDALRGLPDEGQERARRRDRVRSGRGGDASGSPARLPAMRAYEGLLTAMVTPLRPDGSVNEAEAVALGRHLLAHGNDGLVICGTTGESATLDDREQRELIALMVTELGTEGAIIAGAGSNSTHHAVELTEAAVTAGAHGILSVTPYYNRPSPRGLQRHYEEVAAAAQGRPVILYNIPSRTALNLPPGLLAELAQIEGIEAVKQSNPEELQPIDGLAVIAGNDDLLARNLDQGGAGGICVASHVAGPQMRRLFDEPDRRAELDRDLAEVYAAMFVTASPAPVKAALAMQGHDVGGVRLPLVEVDDDERAQIRTVLESHGLLDVPAPRVTA